jgi:hypothetical protein
MIRLPTIRQAIRSIAEETPITINQGYGGLEVLTGDHPQWGPQYDSLWPILCRKLISGRSSYSRIVAEIGEQNVTDVANAIQGGRLLRRAAWLRRMILRDLGLAEFNRSNK